MVLVHDMSSECALKMYEISLKYVWQLSSYRADTILWPTERRTDEQNLVVFWLEKIWRHMFYVSPTAVHTSESLF